MASKRKIKTDTYVRPKSAHYRRPLHDEKLFTVEEYVELVNSGSLTDSVGFGRAVKNRLAARAPGTFDRLHPSEGDKFIPLDATHVAWTADN